jgi:DNA-binding CsgD family transcriptional regulator
MNWDVGMLDEPARLTPREYDVLRLIARGCTYAQAADRLGVSLHTVCSHVKNAYRKLGVRSGAAAVMRAVELRLFGELACSADSGRVTAEAVLDTLSDPAKRARRAGL